MDPETLALVAQSIGKLKDGAKDFAKHIEQMVPPIESVAALSDPIATFGEGLRFATEKIPGLGPAVADLTKQFESMVDAAKTWVSALSPATVAQLDYQLRNLQATLGQAFLPSFQILIDVVNRFAGILNPIAQQLGPVLHKVTEVLAFNFLSAATGLADAFQQWMPLVDGLVKVFESFMIPVHALTAIFTAWVSMLGKVLSQFAGTNDVFETFEQAMKQVARNLLIFAAQLLVALGNKELLKGIIEGIEKGPGGVGGGAIAAPQNVRIQDFASIAADMTKAAFAAGPGGEPLKKSEDYLAEIVPLLKDILTGKTPLEDFFIAVQRMKEVSNKVSGWLEGGIAPNVRSIASDINQFNRESTTGQRFIVGGLGYAAIGGGG